jgi:glycosyltransferase involved in cell wall biosynthesis
MNILFLTITYPEVPLNHNIYTDLMSEMNTRGNDVYVVTSRERRYNKKTELCKENGINVLRVKTGNIQKTNIFEKGIATILLDAQYINAINKYFGSVKFDLVLYSTPPVTLERAVRYVKKRDGAKTYLLLKDIFPQNAVDIGLMKKGSLIYRYFRRKEIRLYKESDFIGCMSKANVEYVLKNNNFIDHKRVEVCPNSIYPVDMSIDKSKRQIVRKKFKIPDEALVFIYGGNLGKPQGISFLKEVLLSNKNRHNCFFMIVGSGTEYGSIEKFITEHKLNNVFMMKSLPKQEYYQYLQACDVGMVFLDPRFTIPNFPSRLLSYMEYCMPVIAATDECTDIRDVMEEGNFGLWCKSGDLEAFNKNLEYFFSNRDKLKIMGDNARKCLEKGYTVSVACDIIMKHFNR